MRKILVSMVIILMLFSIISVKAEDLKNLSFTANEYEIKKGEEVVVTISSNELTGIEGTLKYDSSVMTLTNKDSGNSFTLNDATGKFALANLQGEESISVNLTFKSKEDTTVESTVISVIEIVGSNKTGEGFDFSDKSVTIKFKVEEPPVDPEPDPEPEPDPAPNPDPELETPPVEEQPEDDFEEIPEDKPTQIVNNTINKVEKLPDTGSGNIFIIITIVGTISIAAYITYKKYNF